MSDEKKLSKAELEDRVKTLEGENSDLLQHIERMDPYEFLPLGMIEDVQISAQDDEGSVSSTFETLPEEHLGPDLLIRIINAMSEGQYDTYNNLSVSFQIKHY